MRSEVTKATDPYPVIAAAYGGADSRLREKGAMMSPMAVDADLQRRIAEGRYVVDPHAVAEAMLRRSADRADARRLSRMLVSGEVDRLPRGVEKPDPGAGRD